MEFTIVETARSTVLMIWLAPAIRSGSVKSRIRDRMWEHHSAWRVTNSRHHFGGQRPGIRLANPSF